jgi:hypothetical protein
MMTVNNVIIICDSLFRSSATSFSLYLILSIYFFHFHTDNFETLVQPALGLLMIAAIAGNFFQEEEVDQNNTMM